MLRTKGVENYVFLKNLLHRPDQGRRAIERLVALTSHIWFRRVIIGCLNFDRKPFRGVFIAHVTFPKNKIAHAKISLYVFSIR